MCLNWIWQQFCSLLGKTETARKRRKAEAERCSQGWTGENKERGKGRAFTATIFCSFFNTGTIYTMINAVHTIRQHSVLDFHFDWLKERKEKERAEQKMAKEKEKQAKLEQAQKEKEEKQKKRQAEIEWVRLYCRR